MTSKPFKPGDIAILQNLSHPFTSLNGDECEVVSHLDEFHLVDIFGTKAYVFVYKIKHRGLTVGVLPENIRHKQEPQEEIGKMRQVAIEV
jgi:hypothetical protein